MDKLKYIRVQKKDGTYGEKIPVAVNSNNIRMTNGDDLQTTINTVEESIQEVNNDIYSAQIDQDGIIYPSLRDRINTLATDIEKEKSLMIILSTDVQMVTTDSKGNFGDYSNCECEVYVYFGGEDITNSPDLVWSIKIPSTVIAVWDATQHKIKVSYLSNNYSAIQINVTYKNDLSVKKNFLIKKVFNGTSPITVEIESSAGTIFKNHNVSTFLTAIVKQDNEDISDKVTNFHWIKYDEEGNEDTSWSRFNTQTIQISPADLFSKAIFKCEISL